MEVLFLAVFGLLFGSFVTALTWRLHEGKNFVSDRSQCESCGHKLGWQDLIPIFSWFALKGRCRYCKQPISWLNPVIELAMAIAFIVSYIFWPTDLLSWQAWASFIIWLIYVVLLGALLIYDLRWMMLPNRLVFPLLVLGLIDAAVRIGVPEATPLQYLEHVILGAGILGGFYWLVYLLSKGRWVGFGDVKLGIFMGVVLGWPLALLTLFLANIIGSLVLLPGLISGKLEPQTRVPFGPFLIVAFFVAGLFGAQLIHWYLSLVFAL